MVLKNQSVLWMPIAWCFSTWTSVATIMINTRLYLYVFRVVSGLKGLVYTQSMVHSNFSKWYIPVFPNGFISWLFINIELLIKHQSYVLINHYNIFYICMSKGSRPSRKSKWKTMLVNKNFQTCFWLASNCPSSWTVTDLKILILTYKYWNVLVMQAPRLWSQSWHPITKVAATVIELQFLLN